MSDHHPHIEVNKLDEKKKKNLVVRVIVSVILAVVCLPALFIGSWFWFCLLSFFLGFAIYEFIHATGKKYPWYVWVLTYVSTIGYTYWGFVKANISAYFADPSSFAFSLESQFDEPMLSWYAIVTSMGIYFVFGLFNENFKISDIAYLFLMSIFVGLGFQCMMFLRYCPFVSIYGGSAEPTALFRFLTSAFLFLYVVIVAFGNDIMAYFVGVFFGKHKMSKVSPNKSWEGFFGGWILSGALAFGFACLVESLGHPMLPNLLIFGPESKWWAVLILSFVLPLFAVVGDLTLSLIKRFFGIKDYGKLLAAHGGVLDRVDSLMTCAIVASILVVLFEKGASFFA